MEKISDDNQKQILLSILTEIDQICKKHKINYYLDSGTLLGAIRHGGFIPWDDDIDLTMFREDYEKFIDLMRDRKDFKSISYQFTKNYGQAYAKITDTSSLMIYENVDYMEDIGINVDIFPIDTVPTGNIRKKIYFNKIWYLRKLMLLSSRTSLDEGSWFKKIIWKIMRQFDKRRIISLVDKEAQKYNHLTTNEFTSILPSLTKHKVLKKEWFEGHQTVKFEHLLVPVPCGYDEMLKYQYGEYNKLPPIEDRVSHHFATAYYRENSI